MTQHANSEVDAYAARRGLTPGTLLWATDVPLTEDAFRSGAKNASAADLGDSLDKAKVKELKAEFNPIDERFWWKIEPGQPLPAGLQLVYDGVPPGHCTPTVAREMTVAGFLSLVSQLHFSSAGVSYYGRKA